MDYFYSAAMRRSRGALWPILALALIVMPNGNVSLSLYSFGSYPDLVWGNYRGPSGSRAGTTYQVKLRLTDVAEES